MSLFRNLNSQHLCDYLQGGGGKPTTKKSTGETSSTPKVSVSESFHMYILKS